MKYDTVSTTIHKFARKKRFTLILHSLYIRKEI